MSNTTAGIPDAAVKPTLFKRITEYDYSDTAETAARFLTAHMGCIAAPFVTTAVLGMNGSASSDYMMSVTLGATTMLGMDALVQKVKVDSCMRCINSKLDGFKRQGKIMAQAVLMSSAMFFGHHMLGHHAEAHDSNQVQRDAQGNQFIVRDGAWCGPSTMTQKTDTIWLTQPKGMTP